MIHRTTTLTFTGEVRYSSHVFIWYPLRLVVIRTCFYVNKVIARFVDVRECPDSTHVL